MTYTLTYFSLNHEYEKNGIDHSKAAFLVQSYDKLFFGTGNH